MGKKHNSCSLLPNLGSGWGEKSELYWNPISAIGNFTIVKKKKKKKKKKCSFSSLDLVRSETQGQISASELHVEINTKATKVFR